MKTQHVWAPIVVVVAFLVANRWGQAQTSQRSATDRCVRAECFEIIDPRGVTVARIAPSPQGFPGICITFGNDPRAVASLFAIPNKGTFLQIGHDPALGSVNVGLSPNSTLLSIEGGSGAGTIEVQVPRSGAPLIEVKQKDGTAKRLP